MLLCYCVFVIIMPSLLCFYVVMASLLLFCYWRIYTIMFFQLPTHHCCVLCYCGFITIVLLLEELHHKKSSTSNVYVMNYYSLTTKLFLFCCLQFEFFSWFVSYHDLHCDYVGQSKFLMLCFHCCCTIIYCAFIATVPSHLFNFQCIYN
jgi:hypothetical protein